MRSLVASAINDDTPPELVVELNPYVPPPVVDGIVRDLEQIAHVRYAHFSLTTDNYSIPLTPKDRNAGQKLLKYWENNPNIDYIWVNGVTEAAVQGHGLDGYLQ